MELKRPHAYEDRDLSRVRIEQIQRRTWGSSDRYRDKSFNRIYVDGEHVGFLAMETGWSKPWTILDVRQRDVVRCCAKHRSDCRAEICERFAMGNLKTDAQFEAVEAERRAAEEEKRRRDREAHLAARRQIEEDRATAGHAARLLERLEGKLEDERDAFLVRFAVRVLRDRYKPE